MRHLLLYAIFSLPFYVNAQWTALGHGNSTATGESGLSIHAIDEQTFWATSLDFANFSPSHNIYKSTDGGQTITHLSLPIQQASETPYTVFGLDGMTAWVGVGSVPTQINGNVYKTTDGGATWQSQFNDTLPKVVTGIHFWDAQEGFLLTTNDLNPGIDDRVEVYRTMNGGDDWELVAMPDMQEDEALSFFSTNGLIEVRGDNIWFGTVKGRIWHSTDRAVSWQVSNLDNTRTINSIAFKDANNGVACSCLNPQGFSTPTTKVWTSSDAGQSWTEVAVLDDIHCSSLQYIPTSPATYVANGGQSEGKMMVSTDDGKNWHLKDTEKIAAADYLSPNIAYGIGALKNDNKGGIYRFNSSFENTHAHISTFAGNAREGNRLGNAQNANFYNPKGMCADSDGNIYLADDYNTAIKKIDTEGNVKLIAGLNELPDIFGIVPSVFYNPQDLTFKEENVLLVANTFNYNIIEIDISDEDNPVLSVFAGSGVPGSQDGPAAEASFSAPRAILTDTEANVYVAEDTKIRKISTDGMVSTFVGSDNTGFEDGMGTQAQFELIWGMDWAPNGDIIVADAFNHAIRRVTLAGQVTTIAGNGNADYIDGPDAQFSYPEDVAVDAQGNIFVADGNNSVVRKIDTTGFTTTVAGTKYEDYQVGEPGPEIIDGHGEHATFSRLRNLLLLEDGSLLVSTFGQDVIRKVNFGVPSSQLVVMEMGHQNPLEISLLSQSPEYNFYADVKNILPHSVDEVRFKVEVRLNNALKYSRTSETLAIAADATEQLTLDNSFSPNEAGVYDVTYKFYKNGDLFYTANREVHVSDNTMDHSDGLLYLFDSYANYFTGFQGGYGVSYTLSEPDTLTAIASVFITLNAGANFEYAVYKIEEDEIQDVVLIESGILFDSLESHDAAFKVLQLENAAVLEAGEYLFTIKGNTPDAIYIAVDNDLSSSNNWIEDFSSSLWTRSHLVEEVGGNDLAYMIRPVFGQVLVPLPSQEPNFKPVALKVFPNPCTDHIQLSLDAQAQHSATLELRTLDGKIIDRLSIKAGQTLEQNVEHLASGTYLIQVYQAKQRPYAFKFIKQ